MDVEPDLVLHSVTVLDPDAKSDPDLEPDAEPEVEPDPLPDSEVNNFSAKFF
jgi:hypothetical protein